MAYGRIYIDNLRKKVTVLFDELKSTNELNEKKFIERFKQKYPKDYKLLVYEWEFKIHEYKKNRKGSPKSFPLRPDKILSNMYRNYYFKLIKNPIIKKHKTEALNKIRVIAGQQGYKIKIEGKGTYNIIKRDTKEIVQEHISFREVKEFFHYQDNKERGDKNKKSNTKGNQKH